MYPQLLAEHFYVLGHPYFQTYLIMGKNKSALVEMGISATAGCIIKQLSSLGVSPDYLIITHPHSDHICGLDALKKAFPDASVVAGNGAAAFLSHPKAVDSLIWEDRHMASFMSKQGFVFGQPAIECFSSLSGCQTVTDGEVFDLGGMNLHFLDAKGHAPGSLLVLVAELNALLVSDSLGYRISGKRFFPIFFTGYAEYMETINIIAALNPEIIGMAHHGFMRGPDVQKTICEARAAAEAVMARIVRDTREDDLVAQGLFQDYYRDELTLYTKENILVCCRLLVRRAREYHNAQHHNK